MKLALLLIVTFILNLPAGYFRARYKRLSWQWLAILHAPIPLIIFPAILCTGHWNMVDHSHGNWDSYSLSKCWGKAHKALDSEKIAKKEHFGIIG